LKLKNTFKRSGFCPWMVTEAPSLAKISADSWPMPEEEPEKKI
jgi:hypothetical protein